MADQVSEECEGGWEGGGGRMLSILSYICLFSSFQARGLVVVVQVSEGGKRVSLSCRTVEANGLGGTRAL